MAFSIILTLCLMFGLGLHKMNCLPADELASSNNLEEVENLQKFVENIKKTILDPEESSSHIKTDLRKTQGFVLSQLPQSKIDGMKHIVLKSTIKSCDFSDAKQQVNIALSDSTNILKAYTNEILPIGQTIKDCTKQSPFAAITCLIKEYKKIKNEIPQIITEMETNMTDITSRLQNIQIDLSTCSSVKN
uniref:Protein TsetseEP domain-containing protein n=2 Tax=Clastoptera arizonana TaxID=38151 RepID=A0A1B6DKU3_9HEMI